MENTPHKIVFLEIEAQDKKLILSKYPNAIISEGVLKEEEIITQFKDAEILCPFIYSPITKKVINALPNLKFIVTRSVGYNHIDLKSASEKNIPVCNVPDYGAHAIAEHVFALILSSIRQVKEGDDRVELKYFSFQGLRGIGLKGKTLGIVGVGKIGKNVARIASLGFEMNVLAYDPNADKKLAKKYHFQYVSLKEIWKNCDIISFHVPLLDKTRHMVNAQTIKKMKKGVVLVNTARGGIIDTDALIGGLKSEKIQYAALDVLEHEKNIAANKELLYMPNVTVTPHVAFYVDDTVKKMYEESFLSIDEFQMQKKLSHCVSGI